MHSIACENLSGSCTMRPKDQLSKASQPESVRFSVHHSSPPSTCCTKARSSYTIPWRSAQFPCAKKPRSSSTLPAFAN